MTKRSSPVLFLDIDGVILSGEELWASRNHRYLPEAKIAWLNYVCLSTACRVVVSSVWRMHDETPDLLTAAGFAGRFHKDWRTGGRRGGEGPALAGRGYEISQWLKAHPKVDRYAIVDDDSDMLPEQRPYFVQTRFTTGIMRQHANDLIQILNGQVHRHPSLWPEIRMHKEQELALAA